MQVRLAVAPPRRGVRRVAHGSDVTEAGDGERAGAHAVVAQAGVGAKVEFSRVAAVGVEQPAAVRAGTGQEHTGAWVGAGAREEVVGELLAIHRHPPPSLLGPYSV